MRRQEKRMHMSDNILLLQDLLSQVVSKDLGQQMSQKIEQIRHMATEEAETGTLPSSALVDTIGALSDKDLLHIAQTFNQALNLLNTTEQLNLISEQALGRNNPIQMARLCQTLQEQGKTREEIIHTLENLSIDLVLTAHPTEINRRSLINNLNETSDCLAQLDRPELVEHKRAQLMRRLRQLIVQYWYTDEIRKYKPTPVEEAKWGNDVIESSLWDAVPEFIRELNVQLGELLGGYTLPIEAKPMQFTAWMGGDRDGNPNVTAQVTKEVLLQNRRRAAQLFLQDIEALVKELSMSNCTDEFRELLGDKSVQEPYRELMKRLRGKLKQTIIFIDHRLEEDCRLDVCERDRELIIWDNADLWEPLIACYHSLCSCGMEEIAGDKLTDTLRRVQAFGVTLVKTDIRQESTRHTEAISELVRYLGLGDYGSWSEEEKQAFLIRELSSKRPLIPLGWQPSPETAEVLDCCRVIAQTPKGVIPVYLISMTQSPSDVLAVHLLLKETGCPYTLGVGPLFETLEDLENAAQVMKHLFSIHWYRGSIDNKQMVMIGYSDSAKDAGSLAAGWAQYCAQEELIKVCKDAGVQLTLFHGRGGTIGRGGGPAKTALFSQPPGSLQGGLRVTVQGEMIRFKFGQPALAIRTLALYIEAIMEANLLPPPVPQDAWRETMNELRDVSCKIYQDVVRGDDNFIHYFEQTTPITELSSLPMGSRPAKRRAAPTVDSLRAIPWIFSWSQNRLMLPAWLGAGEALQRVIDQGKQEILETMYKEWPFFNTRISMLEMVYAKSDVAVASYYDRVLVNEVGQALGNKLRHQMLRDINTILSISHDHRLMEDVQEGAAENIEIRNSFTLPLNLLQVELLKRSRATESPSQDTQQALMVTISGIAAGVRNSG